jgi:lysophospholipase L1-like esterase
MFFTLNSDIFNFAQKEKIILFDIFDIFCDRVNKDCMFKTNKNELIFFDGNHISQKGAEYISQNLKFSKLFDNN